MLGHSIIGSSGLGARDGRHAGPAEMIASLGMSCAHHLRGAAPHLLTALHRASPLAPVSATRTTLPALADETVSVHEWDTGRWFVTTDDLGMLGEIERTDCCYLVSHSADAKGATFALRSLAQATAYFEEYAAALDGS